MMPNNPSSAHLRWQDGRKLDEAQPQAGGENPLHHRAARSPQGNAETNLASATRDQIGHHAISSDHRKSQRQTSKDAKDSQRSVLNAQRVFHRVAQRVNVSLQELGMDVGEFSAHAGNKLARISLRT